jgi:hypothetical protein
LYFKDDTDEISKSKCENLIPGSKKNRNPHKKGMMFENVKREKLRLANADGSHSQ